LANMEEMLVGGEGNGGRGEGWGARSQEPGARSLESWGKPPQSDGQREGRKGRGYEDGRIVGGHCRVVWLLCPGSRHDSGLCRGGDDLPASLVLGWLYARTRNLLAPILFCGLANAFYCLLIALWIGPVA